MVTVCFCLQIEMVKVADSYCGESIHQELISTSPRAGSRLSLLYGKFYFEIRLIDLGPLLPHSYEWSPPGVRLKVNIDIIRLRAKKGPAPPPPPLGNFADISYLKENFKPHLLRDVCTLCSGALVSDSLLHMLL